MNLAELVRYWARWRPDHTAIIHNDVRTSWAELDAKSDAVARGLHAAGVAKGDRVGLLMTNRLEAPIVTVACLKLGAIFVPLNFRLTGIELLPLLEDAECSVVVTEAKHLSQLELAKRTLPFEIFVTDSNDARPFEELVIDTGAAPQEAIALNDAAFIC